jgi:hypothetical protein
VGLEWESVWETLPSGTWMGEEGRMSGRGDPRFNLMEKLSITWEWGRTSKNECVIWRRRVEECDGNTLQDEV